MASRYCMPCRSSTAVGRVLPPVMMHTFCRCIPSRCYGKAVPFRSSAPPALSTRHIARRCGVPQQNLPRQKLQH